MELMETTEKLLDNSLDNVPVKPKHAGGRPKKYKDLILFDEKIETFFDTCKETKKIPTLTGLAIQLGMDRSTLLEYSREERFSPSIKKARARIEEVIEDRLINGKPPIGLIFWLKNNAGWKDVQETKHSGNVTHGFVALPPLKEKTPIPVKTIEGTAKTV